MNKFIKQQLEKVKKCVLPPYDENTLQLIIPKQEIVNSNNLDLIIGHFYRVKLADYIINEPSNFTLSTNWNHGLKPKELYLNIEVQKIMGKMVYVNSTTVQSGDMWEGWLPFKSITILEEI